mgnify:CR=1 FL=1
MTDIVVVYPSGAKLTITTERGYRSALLQLPWHADSLYDRLLNAAGALKPVDTCRADRAIVESRHTSCDMVPGVESQQTLKK